MPKGKAFDWLKRRADIPKGMFSTLEDLIEAAPQERMTAKQWKEYLAPGRILEREGVKFPLKKEEIEYTKTAKWLDELIAENPGALIDRKYLLEGVQGNRPRIEQGPVREPSDMFSQYSTQGPRRLGYFENETYSPDFGDYRTHFEPDTLSWHRGSLHALGADPRTNPGAGGVLRLVDEIQSDRHSDAAEKIISREGKEIGRWAPGPGVTEPPVGTTVTRRGYRTPEQEARIKEITQEDEDNPEMMLSTLAESAYLRSIPPDAPFKSPADYGRLELKRAIANAVDRGDQYVGVTPSEGPIDWFNFNQDNLDLRDPDLKTELSDEARGSQYVYDQIYPGELRKLAQQYSAPFREIDVPVNRKGSGTLGEIVETGSADLPDYLMRAQDFEPEQYRILIDNLISGYRRDLPRTAEVKNALNRAQEELNRVLMGADSPGYVLPDTRDLEFTVYQLDELYNRHKPATQTVAKVPAMELTPEVVEKIKKAGIPLWAITSGIIGLDALSGGEPEEPTTFSVGGAVDTEHMNDTDENGVPDDLQSYVGDVLSALTPSTMTGGSTLRKIAELPGSADGIERRKQMMVGILSQLYGLDLEGNATPLGYDSRRSSATPANRMSGILSKLRPGAADETLALPHYFNFIPGIDNEVSENSANRQEYLEQVIRDQLGIPDQPDEWDEELAYNLGIMLGQFPVAPGSAAKTAATKVAPGILRGIGRGAKKVGSAALEFFSPVISPKAGNYAAGTAFGTGMMTGGRKLGELLEDEEEEQPSPGYAEGGQVDINSLLGISSRDNSPTAQATKYVGSPMSYEEARTYGQGPERKFFEHNSAPLNIDFSKTEPAAGGGGAGGTGGGSGSNNLAGVLGSLPIVWEGLGKADSLLNTNLQGGLKDLGTGILTKLGLGSGAAAGGSSLAGLGALEIAPNAATSLPASLGGTGAATGAGTGATAGTGAAAGTGAGLTPGAGAGVAQVAVPAAIAYAAYKVLPQFVNSFKKDPARVQGSYNADTGQLEIGFNEFTNQYMDRFGITPDDVLGRLSPILDQYVTATQGGEKWGDKEMLNWAMQQGLVSKPQDYLDPYDRIVKQKGRKKYDQWMSSADKDSALDMLTYQLLAENNGLWYGKGDIMHALKQAYGLE